MGSLVFYPLMRGGMVRIPSRWSTQSQTLSGKTLPTEGFSDEDLSLEILVKDLYNLLRVVFLDPAAAPSLLVRAIELFFPHQRLKCICKLVGHSMGGAVVVHTIPHLLEAKYRVSGVVVLDVVEGTAIDALPHMPAVLNSRPGGFDSVSDAIEWQYVPSIPSCTPLICTA